MMTRNDLINSCFEGTIVHAFDAHRLKQEKRDHARFSFAQKLLLGARLGAKTYFRGTLLFAGINALMASFLNRGSASELKLNLGKTFANRLFTFVQLSLLEEFICRYLLQNGIKILQNKAYQFPAFRKIRGIEWLCSPSARIVATNMIFALAHCCNLRNNDYPVVLAQASAILAESTESISYETSGDFVTPFACHLVCNCLSLARLEFMS